LLLQPIEPFIEPLDHVQDALKPWIRRVLRTGVAISMILDADFRAFLENAVFVRAFLRACRGCAIRVATAFDMDLFARAAASVRAAGASALDDAFADFRKALPDALANCSTPLFHQVSPTLKHSRAAGRVHHTGPAAHTTTAQFAKRATLPAAAGAALGNVAMTLHFAALLTSPLAALALAPVLA